MCVYLMETKAVQSSAFALVYLTLLLSNIFDMVNNLDTVETGNILIQAHICIYHSLTKRAHPQERTHP